MASDEHKKLANILKNAHKNLRESAAQIGAEAAWVEHLKNKENLKIYAKTMKTLATEHWRENCTDSRINWTANFCQEYFFLDRKIKFHHRERERTILDIINPDLVGKHLQFNDLLPEAIKLLDVGSCYNPFRKFDFILPTAIDIGPASDDVFKSDFLKIGITNDTQIKINNSNELLSAPCEYFDVVVFSLLLEYIPSSQQRLQACEKAFNLLKTEGLLIIITPDSRHVGANARLMKTWRYALSLLGFSRIKFEKLEHITCMVFRKSIAKEVPIRWATLHKEPYMNMEIKIPQDFNEIEVNINVNKHKSENTETDSNVPYLQSIMFSELPNGL